MYFPQEIHKQQSLRMFELVQKHPPHWPPFIPPAKPEVTTTGAGTGLVKGLSFVFLSLSQCTQTCLCRPCCKARSCQLKERCANADCYASTAVPRRLLCKLSLRWPSAARTRAFLAPGVGVQDDLLYKPCKRKLSVAAVEVKALRVVKMFY